MTTKKRVWLSWSSGKDSAWALQLLRQDRSFEVAGLVTTVNDAFARVAMHGVRRELLHRQAAATGLPLHEISLPWPCGNDVYESAMAGFLSQIREDGVRHLAFGDLFLQDIRAYREESLARSGVAGVFPIWGRDTRSLARDMLDAGLRATVTCVDPKQLPSEFAGLEFGHEFIDALPDGIDPCGENGEFHTFAWSGPMFSSPLETITGSTVERDGFLFTDLLPANGAPSFVGDGSL